MDALAKFINRLPQDLQNNFKSLDSPLAIQDYLDSIPYIGEELDRSPLRVMQDRQAHCLDGGFFAALALRHAGYPPLVLDLVPEPGTDDDHVLALFKRNGCWGAIAKSNYTGLRFREPVYRDLRELAMSYFEHFFNSNGEKTLRGYTRPMDLSRFDHSNWMWDETAFNQVARRFYARKSIPLISQESVERLHRVDDRSFTAGTMGTDFNWVYKKD